MMPMHFKDHARAVIDDCNAGTQRCDECPLLECCDNTTILARELKRKGLDSVKIGERFDRDRQLAARARRRGTGGD
jgi:hypothetical protein